VSAVGGVRWIGTTPLPVEITNHTDWWVQLLPVAGPTVVAIFALIGVILANKTTVKVSRQEREDARERDYLQWRREALRQLGAEIMEAAVEAIDEYSKLPGLFEQPVTPNAMEPIDRTCRRIAANGEKLSFLTAPLNAERCTRLRELMINDELTKEYRAVLERDKEAGQSSLRVRVLSTDSKARFEERVHEVKKALKGVAVALEAALKQLDPPKPPTLPERHF
jgi:hypothetical protein